MQTMEKIANGFLEKISRSNHIKLIPYSEEKWFNGAYSTIMRTLHDEYRPIKNKDKCRRELFDGLQNLNNRNFNDEWCGLVGHISTDHKISIGHSQKMAAILCKYAVVVYLCSPKDLPKKWINLVVSNIKHMPIPIDAIVLYNLKCKCGDDFEDVIANKYWDKKKNNYNYNAKITQAKDEYVCWSRLTDYKTYWSLQERIKHISNKKKMSPIEYEMRELWS